MANNSFQPTSFTIDDTFATLTSYLEDAGFPGIAESSVRDQGYLRNQDSSIALHVGFGTSAPTSYETVGPYSQIPFNEGINVNQVWVKSASSTIDVGYAEGASGYVPPLVNGVIGTITVTADTLPKADADGNLVDSSIVDDGSAVTISEDTSVDANFEATGDTVLAGTLTLAGTVLGATAAELNQFNDVSAYTETVSASGAVSVTKVLTKLAVAGGGAVTLAAPDASMVGQVKTIQMTADTGDVTMALTNVVGGSNTTTCTWDDAGDALVLLAGASSKWIVIKEYGVVLT